MRYGRYLLALAILAVVITASAFAWKKLTPKPQPSPEPSPVSELAPQEIIQVASQPAQLQGKSFILQNPSVVVNDPMTNLISFEPDSAFTTQDKEGILNRIVEPYVLYQTEIQGTQKLDSIVVSQNTQASAKDYPFLFSATFDGGVSESFVIAREGQTFQWFVPECLGACPFSENFKKKYPEIIKKSGGA
jgi:hypothetical protein